MIIKFLNRDHEVMRKFIISLFIASSLPTCALYAQNNANIPANKIDLDTKKTKNSSTLIWEPVTEHSTEHRDYSNKNLKWERINYQENIDLKRINSNTSIIHNKNNTSASPLKPDGIKASLSEKGINLGVFKNLSNKNQINIGIIYFDSKLLPFDIKYKDDRIKSEDNRKLQYRNIGLNLGFKRFLTGDLLTSGIYMGLNGEVISPSLKSRINMENESYKSGKLTITCSDCGDIVVETDPGKLVFIPSLTLGYETKIRQNLKADFGIGLQYINLPDIVWSEDNEYGLPSQLSSRADQGVEDLNDYKDSIPNVIPTLKVGLTYIF